MEGIPGFVSGSDITEDEHHSVTPVEIKEGNEWRFEIPFKQILVLKVTEGIGEIFGTELPVNVEIQLTGVKYALYAPLPEGCKIEYYLKVNKENITTSSESSEISEYISEDNSMKQYINLHFALEAKRQEISDYNLVNSSSDASKPGPRVLVIGGQFSGKTSLCKILSSYAFKMDRTPVLVNLNPRDGVFSLPGSVTATPISDNFDLEAAGGYGGTTTSGSTYHNPKQPLVKNYGFENINSNFDYYKHQISKLGLVLMSRMEEDIDVKNSGIIVDTPPLSIKDISLIENIVADFEIDHIVIMGNEKLLIDLTRKFNHKVASQQLNLIKVPKSEGAVEVEDTFIRKCQEESIKQYFNGNFRNPLSPFKTEILFSDFIIYKGVESSEYNSSLLFAPAGDSFAPEIDDDNSGDRKDDSLESCLNKVEDLATNNLENLIVAITHLPLTNKLARDLMDASVLGYVHVSKVDEAKGKIRVLMPVPGAFPRNILIATSIGYTE